MSRGHTPNLDALWLITTYMSPAMGESGAEANCMGFRTETWKNWQLYPETFFYRKLAWTMAWFWRYVLTELGTKKDFYLFLFLFHFPFFHALEDSQKKSSDYYKKTRELTGPLLWSRITDCSVYNSQNELESVSHMKQRNNTVVLFISRWNSYFAFYLSFPNRSKPQNW